MRRRIATLVGLLAAATFGISCSNDARNAAFPTSPTPPGQGRSDIIPGTCTTLSNLKDLVNATFGAGSPNPSSAIGKLNDMDRAIKSGDLAGAQSIARTIVSFVQLKAQQGTLGGTHAQVQALIGGVLCYAGLSPDTFLVLPSDQAQVLLANAGQSGVSLQPNTVTVPTLITVTQLNTAPLNTKLDQYPGFIALTNSSPITKPAVVGVCASSAIPADVLARLRLGHQATGGFEITPSASAAFLNCPTSTTGQSRLPGWLQKLASLVVPKDLYATESLRGVGGLVTEFSPFAPVDAELTLRSGAGGLVTEFQRTPTTGRRLGIASSSATTTEGAPAPRLDSLRLAAPTGQTPGAAVATVVAGQCTQIDALIGNPVEQACRPAIQITTHLGTLLQSVPVGWAVGLGGGVVAPEASGTHVCGDFGPTAANTTDLADIASICWTLGGLPGTNTVIVTPFAGGDVPAGVTFNPPNFTFTATAKQLTPVAGATGGSFPYDGQPHPGTGTCSNSLTPALSYTIGSTPTSAPTDVGTYTLTVTCGAGNPLYVTVATAAQIQITAAVTSTSVTCPASVAYTGLPQMPCSATVTGPGLSQPVAPTYTSNVNAGMATANVMYPAGGNYQMSSGSANFQITGAPTVAAVSCPASVLYTGSPAAPCTGSVTGPGLSQPVTPTYTSNIVGTATATVNYAGGGNYLASVAFKNFQIRYVQSGCFSSPIYNVMPTTKQSQNKGSNLPIKCSLLTAQGAGVSNATGSLLVQDLGPNGTSTPVTAFSLANAFTGTTSGNYSYGLNTSGAGFISTHFYSVTATWSDGSTTNGFFYIK